MNIGFILAGGMGKGAYQVGAFKALSKYFSYEDVKYVSASSVGALNAYGFSCGKTELLEEMWRSVNKDSERMFISRVIKSDFLRDAIVDIAKNEAHARRFIFPLVKMNLKERELLYINLKKCPDPEKRSEYLRASIAVLLFGCPVEIDGEKYYDGALVDNMPSAKLKKYDPDIDFYIAMYFDSNVTVFDDPELDQKTLKLCFDDNTRIKRETILTAESINYMISEGERMTLETLDFLFDGNTDDVDYIKSRIKSYTKLQSGEKSKLITGQRAIAALNDTTKHLVTRK